MSTALLIIGKALLVLLGLAAVCLLGAMSGVAAFIILLIVGGC